MAIRVELAILWTVTWALLGRWVFDVERHINRPGPFVHIAKPTQTAEEASATEKFRLAEEAERRTRAQESTRLSIGVGAVAGALGGVLAVLRLRTRPWRVLGTAILVGAIASGVPAAIHVWRHPIHHMAPPFWNVGLTSALLGAIVAIPVGILLMAVNELAFRREQNQSVPVPQGEDW